MRFGFHLLAWRAHRKLGQSELAQKAGLLRPYVSRLERDDVDPSLSTLRRLAFALDLSIGQLIDSMPEQKNLGKEEMDHLAKFVLRENRRRRKGEPSLRRLRVQLGEQQWKALQRRIEKHAASYQGFFR